MRTISIENYDISNLERAYYNYMSYLNLLNNALTYNNQFSEDSFRILFNKYRQAIETYLKEKDKFQLEYINNIKNESEQYWEVIFFNKTVILK